MPTPTGNHYAHGKLLLTGEYYVLDGATALAVPTRRGQRFTLSPKAAAVEAETLWQIHYPDGHATRHIHIYPDDWRPNENYGRDAFKERLMSTLFALRDLGVDVRTALRDRRVDCTLEFPADWGLGSSSTLIDFLATYFGVDPYLLLQNTFGGSGYDLACARATGPLLYRRQANGPPQLTDLDWDPDWLRQTYFVHLNRKQNSREGIATYRQSPPSPENLVAIGQLTQSLIDPTLHLRTAAQLIESHETLIAASLGLRPVKQRFPDFPGTLKSLGAWGGDFIWVLSEWPAGKVGAYFNERGFSTFIPYHDLVL